MSKAHIPNLARTLYSESYSVFFTERFVPVHCFYGFLLEITLEI